MGAFIKRVRKGRIPAPTTPQWSVDKWEQSFASSTPHDEQDLRVFAAGKWFATMFESHRTQVPELATLGLPSDELIRAAISGINRNWIIANEQIRPQGKPGDVIAGDEMLSRRITIEPWGIEVDPNGLMEAIVDTMRHIVFASGPVAPQRAPVAEILQALMYRSIVSSGYLFLESLWKDCLWNSWVVLETPERDVVQPTNLREAAAEAAARYRGEKVMMAHWSEVQGSWPQLAQKARAEVSGYRIVKEIRGTGKQLEIVTRMHRDDEVPGAHEMHMTSLPSWLDHLVDQELPKIAQVTLRLLLRAWDFVRTLADALQRRMPTDTEVVDLGKLWAFSPALDESIVRNVLARALSIPSQIAGSLLEVLTMQSMKDADPWLKPLVSVNGRSFLMLPVALTANSKRLIEHWLTIGGVDLGTRGPLFEQSVRSHCADGIAASDILKGGAACAATSVELDPAIGDMDLVCLIGNTVIVGEVKCTTVPASAVDRANYSEVLNDASEQVLRKVKHASANVTALAAATGWPLTAPRFIPLVITTQELGAGQLIIDVPVVDSLIFSRYFDKPFLDTAILSREGAKKVRREVRFYRTLREAEDNIEMYLRAPPQLRYALSWVRVTEVPLLTATLKPTFKRELAVLPSKEELAAVKS